MENQRITTVSQPPFALNVYVADPNITTGGYTLRAVAFDDVDNSAEDSVVLQFALDSLPTTFTWSQPPAGGALSQFPATLKAKITNSNQVDKIDVYARAVDGSVSYINTVRQFPTEQFSLAWQQKPAAGSYTLFTRVTNHDGYTYETAGHSIIIK